MIRRLLAYLVAFTLCIGLAFGQVGQIPAWPPTQVVASSGSAPTLAGSVATTTDNTSQTSQTYNLPSGITAAEYLFLLISNSGTAVLSSGLTGWTQLTDGAVSAHIFYKVATGSEGSTVTAGWFSAVTSVGLAFRISGADTSTAPALNTVATGNSAAPDPSVSATLAAKNNLFIAAAFYSAGARTFSAYPTGYGIGQSTTTGTAVAIASAMKQALATTDNPSAFTASGTSFWSAYVIGIQPP